MMKHAMGKRGNASVGGSKPCKRARWKGMMSRKNITEPALVAVSECLAKAGDGDPLSRWMVMEMNQQEYDKCWQHHKSPSM